MSDLYLNFEHPTCKGNSIEPQIVALTGRIDFWMLYTQGVALGYVLLPFQGVIAYDFWHTPSSKYLHCQFCLNLELITSSLEISDKSIKISNLHPERIPNEV